MNAAGELAELRKAVDRVDADLAPLLARRFAIVARLAAVKAAGSLPVADPAREREVSDRAAALAGDGCADDVRAVYGTIFSRGRDAQLAAIARRTE